MVCDDGQEGEVEGSLLKKNDIRVGMGKEMNERDKACRGVAILVIM